MIDDNIDLPEGTDSIIAGAAKTGDGEFGSRENNILDSDRTPPFGNNPSPASSPAVTPAPGATADGITDRIRSGGEQIVGQAGEKARGLVSQGLERTSEALASVSKMVGDTAAGIDERLGPEYGGYARRAAGAIENAANTLAEKNPDELIEDTRGFVRNSPGIALAGAAVVGFLIARLLKTGIGATQSSGQSLGQGNPGQGGGGSEGGAR